VHDHTVVDFQSRLDDLGLGDGNLLGFVPRDIGRIAGEEVEFFGEDKRFVFAVGGIERTDAGASPDQPRKRVVTGDR